MKRGVCILFLFMVCASTHASELTRITTRFPDVPAPPQGSVQWIAKSMRMNGVPMSLRSLRSKLSSDAVLAYYESWSRQQASAERIRSRIGLEDVLGIKSGRHLISIRVQRGVSDTQGTITCSLASFADTPPVSTAFPAPSSVRLVNLQQYEDESGEAEHISFVSTRAPHVEALAFAHRLEDKGWTILRHQSMRASMRGYVIEAQRGAQHAQLSILPGEGLSVGTQVLIVWEKS
jgi:hypothetical protein